MPRLCEVYTGICLTIEDKAWKNLSQGSRRMPVGMTLSFSVNDVASQNSSVIMVEGCCSVCEP